MAPITDAGMAERVATMFVVGAAGPMTSGIRPVARTATKELIKVAFDAVNSHVIDCVIS